MLAWRFGAWLLVVVSLPSIGFADPSRIVRTDSGRVRGVIAGEVVTYKGIPFAAPPVGTLRWRAPQPVTRWQGVRDAANYGNACIQERGASPGEALGAPESEDCLYLNVWRPRRSARNLPVMVWIHGGGLTKGAGSQPIHDGTELAKRGVVMVSINYRLGRLGFFGHPALTREAADNGRLANYGLMDQIAALQWVQRNIAVFGGDPRRVTIFGQSAGAASVLALLVAPEARGLFSGAISQSGYWRGPWARVGETAPDGRKSAEALGIAALAAIDIQTQDTATLRALTIDQIRRLPSHGFEGANFIRDGKILPEDLWVAFRAGRVAPVPLLIGATALETPLDRVPELRPVVAKFIEPYLPAEQQATLISAYGSQQVLDDHLASDFTFAAHAWSLANLYRSHGHVAYRYRFAAMPDGMRERFSATPHSGESPYVFGTLSQARWPMDARDAHISDLTMRYWVAFARDGKLAPPGLPACPMADTDQILHIHNAGAFVEADDRAPRYKELAAFIDPRS
jgi:para-nitrobenzyl esterase